MIPEFYQNTFAVVQERVAALEQAQVWEFGRSAGDRPLLAVAYGEKEPIARTADFSSAMAGHNPKAFYGEGRGKQVLLVVSAIHGGEMESIASVLNLFAAMETGKDRRGKEWPGLREAMSRLRLVVVPCANPDGREHVGSDDPHSWGEQDFEIYYQGAWKDGSAIGWIPSKSFNPLPLDRIGYLGGYHNDRGVNPSHGHFQPKESAPESHALLRLAVEETPDFVLDLHSCGSGPFCIVGERLLPAWANARVHYLDGAVRSLLRERHLGAKPWTVAGLPAHTLALNDMYYAACGAIPMVFEGPHGRDKGNEWSYDQIVNIYLTTLEAISRVGAEEGFKALPEDWGA